MKQQVIQLRGVSVHNLKHVDLDLKPGQLIAFTGVSGSGKSSLAFDTLYVEGQRRYIESLPGHMRRHLGAMPKPEADSITGIYPTIAIEQKTAGKNPRSTVGTITAVYDHLRLLFAHIAEPFCPISHEKVSPTSRTEIAEKILVYPENTRAMLLAPFARGKKGEFKDDLAHLLKKGFSRVRIDGSIYLLGEDEVSLDKNAAHNIDIVIDRITIHADNKERIEESLALALEVGGGMMSLMLPDSQEEVLFSEFAYSAASDRYYGPLDPEDFSFNHPRGMCSRCLGIGHIHDFSIEHIIDPTLSIAEDCCKIAGSYHTVKWGNIYRNLAKIYGFSVKTPWEKLPEEAKEIFLHGTENKWTRMHFTHPETGKRWVDYVMWQGVIAEAKRRLAEAGSDKYREKMHELMEIGVCPQCQGSRLKPYPSAAKLGEKTIFQLCEMEISEIRNFFNRLRLNDKQEKIAGEIVREICSRLDFLLGVGLEYLTLSRDAPSLSGGESQRVRLASQIGSGLVSVLYILDEPSIGLHPRDNVKLLETLKRLRDRGNTVIVVEHDEETMRSADTIVDIGPGAGALGGEILAHGSINSIKNCQKSITGAYLRGDERIEIPKNRRTPKKDKIVIEGAHHHNLKNVTLSLPLGVFTAVTGVSGSGKSSLISDTLFPLLANHHHRAKHPVGKHKKASGLDAIDKVIAIDQSPIGRTPRSNPATYVKVFDEIRNLFAMLPESQAFGYKAGRFSFNVREGSCPYCRGMGMIKISMDFLEDEWIICSYCEGRRFDEKTLAIRYRGKNIHEVLSMSINEAFTLFEDITPIANKLALLIKVGLGYITLGQSATTLSGGEAQRIKLSKELMRPSGAKTLYILDEPTTGLHFEDIHRLVHILQELVDRGSSVVVIEHNMDLIKTADHIIEIGPDGGARGGKIVAEGPPEEVAKKQTPTSSFLKQALEGKSNEMVVSAKTSQSRQTNITVKKAEQNNLRRVSTTISHNQISVFTGPSGSGKSSLAFETIYAEGQRRFVETLSPFARKFVRPMPKPKVEEIEGLVPVIAIEQKGRSSNPRSTVGTITEIYDYLRIVWARLGVAYCPETGLLIKSITPSYIVSKIMELPEKSKVYILAPVTLKRSEPFEQTLERIEKQGYLRIRLGGTYYEVTDRPPFDNKRKNTLEIVVDRFIIKPSIEKRLLDAIDAASDLSNNTLIVATEEKDTFYNLAFAVESTGKSYPPITYRTFSFNSEEGMCETCMGIGLRYGIDLTKDRTIMKYAPIDLMTKFMKDHESKEAYTLFLEFMNHLGIDAGTPLKDQPKEKVHLFFEGSSASLRQKEMEVEWIGIHSMLLRIANSGTGELREAIVPHLSKSSCNACGGSRLNALARGVKVSGITLPELTDLSLKEAREFIDTLEGKGVLKEVISTLSSSLSFLSDIGLEHLSLSRTSGSLSGGEVQRIRLARQLGSGLTGAMYVLDEPTIGLHPHNNHLLNQSLKKLKDLGNTLLLVEHDPMTIAIADTIYDFGPGSGHEGGKLLARGSPTELQKAKSSLTGPYLSGEKRIPYPKTRRKPTGWISVENAHMHNIKGLSLEIPTGIFTCISGVSGSGKSTLIEDLLLPPLQKNALLRKPKKTVQNSTVTIKGADSFDQVLFLDQHMNSQTSRSDLLTYLDLLTPLRGFFASLPEAKAKGLMPRHFSYNHPSGMCKKCRGLGFEEIDLQFMPSVKVPCETCKGYRLNPVSLSVTYKGKHLGHFLKLSAKEAKEALPAIHKITKILKSIEDVGLAYVPFGQQTQTLSGGETARLKLARELIKSTKGKALYLFDEPTIGLHFQDIEKLLPIFQALVKKGHTLIIIEHNLEILANADYVIDMGPGGGDHGGKLVAKGTPEEVAKSKTSLTAHYLKEHLEAGR